MFTAPTALATSTGSYRARARVEACMRRRASLGLPELGYAAIPQGEVCKILNEQTC
jgi:hypothetical protein